MSFISKLRLGIAGPRRCSLAMDQNPRRNPFSPGYNIIIAGFARKVKGNHTKRLKGKIGELPGFIHTHPNNRYLNTRYIMKSRSQMG